MTLEQTISAIRPLDEKSMTAARNRFANIAMPLGGLGLLQDAIVQLAGILGQPVPDLSLIHIFFISCSASFRPFVR